MSLKLRWVSLPILSEKSRSFYLPLLSRNHFCVFLVLSQVDDLPVRQEAVALLGRLFASSHADYGEQYIKNFHDFLGRSVGQKLMSPLLAQLWCLFWLRCY